MNIPTVLNAGDTWAWTESLSQYLPSDGWSLSFSLWKYGQSVVPIVASGSGSVFNISIPATTTAKVYPGMWKWTAYVAKGSDRYTVGNGDLQVRADVASATPGSDFRLSSEVLLEQVDAAIMRLSSREVTSVSWNGRTVTYKDLGTLLADRDRLRYAIVEDERARKIAAGESVGRKILTSSSP